MGNVRNTGSSASKNNNSSAKAIEALSTQMSAMLELLSAQKATNESLQAQLDELKKEKATMMTISTTAAVAESEPVAPVEEFKAIDSDRMVEIIHLYNNSDGLTTTLFLGDGRTFYFRHFGDSIRLKYYEFQQLLGAYRTMFTEKRMFTLGAHDQDIAKIERLPSYDEKCLTKEEIRALVELPVNKLVEIYNRVCDTHKDLILSTWQRGYFNDEPGFRDIAKINALNTASNYKLKTLYDNLTNQG